jgi:tetratricopeptide (TPR) repeat protein
MESRSLPTQNPDALRHFVHGRNALQAWFGTGREQDLQTARVEFAEAEGFDPGFALASFYVALADNELRDSDAAIRRLEVLTQRPIDFLPQAYLQLAYAHTKKYQDYDYFEAERLLDEAEKQAKSRKNRGLLFLIQAYRVFLWAVMGGRLNQGERLSYLVKAIRLGEDLARDHRVNNLQEGRQILFEVHNALGIAYMRKGQQEQAFSDAQASSWATARIHYRMALESNPAGARALQNHGTLLLIEGDQFCSNGREMDAERCYTEALGLYRSSFQLNSRDQFVHLRIAQLCARLARWDEAERYYHSGRKENGSVKPADWKQLENSIRMRDRSILIHSGSL